MIINNIAKLVIAVVLTLAVMVGSGASDTLLDTGFTPQANAGCVGGGSTTGGGGGC